MHQISCKQMDPKIEPWIIPHNNTLLNQTRYENSYDMFHQVIFFTCDCSCEKSEHGSLGLDQLQLARERDKSHIRRGGLQCPLAHLHLIFLLYVQLHLDKLIKWQLLFWHLIGWRPLTLIFISMKRNGGAARFA